MKLGVALLALLAVAVVSAELLPTVDVTEREESAGTDLNGDSPVRQAQRERVDERVARAEAEAEVSASSFLESAAASVPGPALDRLTGAAKTYHPNDQMCVICQFLVQRVQLDMAHFNAVGGFVGTKTAGKGSASNAAAGGTGGEKAAADETSFLEIGSGAVSSFADDEESAAWEEEDAEEAEMLERAAKAELAEQEGDWDAVAALEADAKAHGETDADEEAEVDPASFSETAASTAVTSGLSSLEQKEMAEVMAEMRDEKIVDGVNADLQRGMDETPVLVETDADAAAAAAGAEDSEDADEMVEEEVTEDMISNGDRHEFMDAVSETFDSEIDLSADEKEDMHAMLHGEDVEQESTFQSPSYNADGKSEPMTGADQFTVAETDGEEDAALIQVAEADADADEEEDSAEDEAEMDAEDEEMGIADNIVFVETDSTGLVNSGRRSYARVLHRAEWEPHTVTAETYGEHQRFHSVGGVAGVRGRGVGVANSPRRFRLADALNGRPRWNRFDPTVAPHPNAQRQQAREMWQRLMQMTYDRLEGYCSTRLPEQFTPFCRPMLRRFRVIAEGIRYGDRPNQICMRTKFCPRGSYVRRSPHNVFKHVK